MICPGSKMAYRLLLHIRAQYVLHQGRVSHQESSVHSEDEVRLSAELKLD